MCYWGISAQKQSKVIKWYEDDEGRLVQISWNVSGIEVASIAAKWFLFSGTADLVSFDVIKSRVSGRNYEKEGAALGLGRDESRNTKNRSSRTLIKYRSLLWTDHSQIRINITSRRTTTTKSNKKADRNTAKSRCCDSSDGFPLENETNKNRNGGTPKFMEYRTTDSNNPFLAEKMPVF